MASDTGGSQTASGYRAVPHTADLRVEAWAPTREECLARAVHGVVASFADTSAARPVRTRQATVTAGSDDDLLAALMDEIVYRLDTDGEIPVDVRIDAAPGGVHARLFMAEADRLPLTGAVPKAVTLHGLSLCCDGARWTCAVTLDV